MRSFTKTHVFISVLFLCITQSFFKIHALDTLDPDVSYHSEASSFPLTLLKIRFPEKCEIRRMGNSSYWKVIPVQGRSWMMIFREWEGFENEGSLEQLFKELFPGSTKPILPQWKEFKMIGGERQEVVAGNPLIIRYFLFQKKERIVSVYLSFDSENKTVIDFFQTPETYLEPFLRNSF
ncbi:acyltransferase [Leptospira sp. WS92.C1]